jgi:MinD-like ATPase involved in chromosome partitioning or flagellar assembly
MSKIVSIHSYRGGTGKSNTTANLAALLAMQGLRVGVIDTDIASPGIHVLFKMSTDDMTHHSLNDYLWGKCDIEQAAYDVTANLGAGVTGKIYLIPSSIEPGEIARVLREGYDVGLLNDGYQRLLQKLELDFLLIDTHPGLNEETLLSIAISDILIIVLRPDQQDYQGTGVTVEVARKLGVPNLLLLINKVPAIFDLTKVGEQVEGTYNAEVAAILIHSDEMMALGSADLFVLRYPDHMVVGQYRKLAQKLVDA